MHNPSEFGNIENYLLENKSGKNTSCEQTLNSHIFTGTVDLKRQRFKIISLFLIKNFDEKALEIISDIFFLFCIVTVLATTISFLENETADLFYILGMALAMVPLIISLFVQNVLEYYHDTFCRKCGHKLACEEIGEPVINETSNFGNYTLKVTRHWKCRYCGNVDKREDLKDIFAEKGEMLPPLSLKNIECKNCCGIGTVIEVKKPDIKEIEKKRLTRRYYKCTLCGHEDVNEIEEIITINHSTHTGRI